jgi:hypothetical protein
MIRYESAWTMHETRAQLRDKVTNGRPLPKSVDLRSSESRRHRHLIASLTDEIGGNPTELERALIKQAAALTLKSEALQAAIVRSEDVDPDALIRLSGEIRRVMSSLKVKASKRDAADPVAELQGYLAAVAGGAK